MKARPLSEYHEDMGDMLWWRFPIVEPPWVGTPNDKGREVAVVMHSADGWSQANASMTVGGWPWFHPYTHFTPLPEPPEADS